MVVCMAMSFGHDFHFSRTDMRWNPSSQTVQTTVRVFTDDLELALLERCSGEATVAQLVKEFAEEAEDEVRLQDVVDRLRHLYSLRLISFA